MYVCMYMYKALLKKKREKPAATYTHRSKLVLFFREGGCVVAVGRLLDIAIAHNRYKHRVDLHSGLQCRFRFAV